MNLQIISGQICFVTFVTLQQYFMDYTCFVIVSKLNLYDEVTETLNIVKGPGARYTPLL